MSIISIFYFIFGCEILHNFFFKNLLMSPYSYLLEKKNLRICQRKKIENFSPHFNLYLNLATFFLKNYFIVL